MRTRTQTRVEMERRKRRGTKQPFNLVYFFFCDPCRTSLISRAHPEYPHKWILLRDSLTVGCGCRRFLSRAQVNMQKYRRVNFARATWPKQSRIEELEGYRVVLIQKVMFRRGLSKKETLARIRDEVTFGSFSNARYSDDMTKDWPEQHTLKLINMKVSHSPDFPTVLNNAASISCGLEAPQRTYLLPGFDPRDYLTPYGWTSRELNRAITSKKSA